MGLVDARWHAVLLTCPRAACGAISTSCTAAASTRGELFPTFFSRPLEAEVSLVGVADLLVQEYCWSGRNDPED